MSTVPPAIEKVITEYVQNVHNHPISVANFIRDKQDYIVTNTNTAEENYKDLWTGYLTRIAANYNIPLEKSKPDWNACFSLNNNARSPQPPQSSAPELPAPISTTSNNNTNTNNSYKLSKEDLKSFENMFDELDSEKFWTLSTGTVVELQMKKFALTCIYEHMILDIADDNWKGYFTKEELAEIELIKKPTILELPDEMIKYLDNYKNLETLTDIWNENNKHNFHPINQPVMNWVDTSVARAVDILLKNIHNKYKTEADLMKRIWVLIDCCFDDGELDSISGEYVSKATTEVANSDRTIAATNCMSRRKSGTKTDLLFTTEFLEFGTCEAGKITDANNTKTLCELGKKLPKTLKDMMFVLAKECPSKLRELKTCGFIISGLNILPVLMDCPDGYVARINRPSRFFHHPTNASNFLKNMRSIVRVIYDAKVVMNNVSKVLDSTDDDMNYGSHSDIVLPLSFKPTTIKPSKKRKINSAQSE